MTRLGTSLTARIDVKHPMNERAALPSLNRRLIEAQEKERTRLARELHDDIGQRMAVLAIDVTRLNELLPDRLVDARALTSTVRDQVTELGSLIQGISHRLHSSKLEYLGLAAAASNFCRELSAKYRVTIEYVHQDVPDDLSRDMALALFRVLQEALSNATKHAGARLCVVTLRGAPDHVQLEIADDGCGFDVESALRGTGLGLVSMKERMSLVDGNVFFESGAGRGTRVRARAPFRQRRKEGYASEDRERAREDCRVGHGIS
jgi:signal transduction histidine kinase